MFVVVPGFRSTQPTCLIGSLAKKPSFRKNSVSLTLSLALPIDFDNQFDFNRDTTGQLHHPNR